MSSHEHPTRADPTATAPITTGLGGAGRSSRAAGAWTLILTLEGTGVLGGNGSRRELGPGDMLLCSPDGPRELGPARGSSWETIHACFPPRPQWRAWMRWPAIGEGAFLIHLADDAIRAHARAAMLRSHGYLHKGATAFAHELAMSALEEAILLGAHEATYHAADREGAAPMRAVLEHLAANLRRSHTVASLARLARLSPSRFAHLFKDAVGEPIIAHLTGLRLDEAARLLRAGDLGVREVAEAVGFNSPFHFSRQFKKRHGIDPSGFRRRAAAAERKDAPGPG